MAKFTFTKAQAQTVYDNTIAINGVELPFALSYEQTQYVYECIMQVHNGERVARAQAQACMTVGNEMLAKADEPSKKARTYNELGKGETYEYRVLVSGKSLRFMHGDASKACKPNAPVNNHLKSLAKASGAKWDTGAKIKGASTEGAWSFSSAKACKAFVESLGVVDGVGTLNAKAYNAAVKAYADKKAQA